ncbi:MAG: hypothetical protein ING84_01240 [Cytophagales bacterium]|jgi:hypothetical protein|nr:hypothetical protein [Cytophagales bacterium]MCA6368392.1 hypothetical protein [Cytophagales bacterium]MCA6371471.1 hypothetical protein [Cytophagales bacterium]MCA6374801.1 hypothetical protein [Cytophagales bacterium]MCA6385019.1 hypothetical protein [Cytophagales bacterium]
MSEKVRKNGFITPFALLCFLQFLLVFSMNWSLVTDDLYYNTLGDQLSFERINELIDLNKKWNWVIYLITPMLYLLKFFLVAICLSMGVFLFRFEVGLKVLFKIALLSEFIFLFPSIIKLFWFNLVSASYTFTDLQSFAPLSIVNLFDRANLDTWLLYPLSLLNLFEVTYIITLAYLLSGAIKSDFILSLKLVVFSYGAGLFIWALFITFLTVSLIA